MREGHHIPYQCCAEAQDQLLLRWKIFDVIAIVFEGKEDIGSVVPQGLNLLVQLLFFPCVNVFTTWIGDSSVGSKLTFLKKEDVLIYVFQTGGDGLGEFGNQGTKLHERHSRLLYCICVIATLFHLP
jgi:hypothetical protein